MTIDDCIRCPEGVYCLGEGLHYAPVFIEVGDREDSEEDDICVDNEHYEDNDECPSHVQCPLGKFCPKTGR